MSASETPIVGSRPIHRWDLRPKQAQVHRHLPTVMRGVQERIANHVVTRLLEREPATREEAPGRPEMRIAGLLQGLARLGYGLVERRNELRARVQRRWLVLRPSFGATSSSSSVMAMPTHDGMFAIRSDR